MPNNRRCGIEGPRQRCKRGFPDRHHFLLWWCGDHRHLVVGSLRPCDVRPIPSRYVSASPVRSSRPRMAARGSLPLSGTWCITCCHRWSA